MCQPTCGAAPHTVALKHSRLCAKQNHLGLPHRSLKQQQAISLWACNRLPHTGSELKHSNWAMFQQATLGAAPPADRSKQQPAMCNKLGTASHRIAQAQQQVYVPTKLPWICLTQVSSNTNNRLWPTRLQLTASHRSAGYTQQQACLPAGGLPCLPTRVAQSKHSRAVMYQRTAADCLLRSLKHSNRLCITSYLRSCLTRSRSSTADRLCASRLPDCLTRVAQNWQQQNSATLELPHTGPQAQQQAMYQQATWAASHGRSEATWAMCQQADMGTSPRVSSSTTGGTWQADCQQGTASARSL
jgi:hypothetical protein